jgi:hypothetical protein
MNRYTRYTGIDTGIIGTGKGKSGCFSFHNLSRMCVSYIHEGKFRIVTIAVHVRRSEITMNHQSLTGHFILYINYRPYCCSSDAATKNTAYYTLQCSTADCAKSYDNTHQVHISKPIQSINELVSYLDLRQSSIKKLVTSCLSTFLC